MDQTQRRAILRSSPLVRGLGDAAFEALAALATYESHEPGAMLFHEGDGPERIYIVLEGACEVIKSFPETDDVHVIDVIEAGDSVGALSLLLPASRSVSVRAAARLEVASFSTSALGDLLLATARDDPYQPLMRQLQAALVERLEAQQGESVRLQRAELALLRQRSQLSNLLVYLVSLLCLWFGLTHWLASVVDLSRGTTVITAPLIVLLLLVAYRPVRSLGLTWAEYGVRRQGLSEALRDGVLYALPWVVLLTALKALLAPHMALFDLAQTLARQKGSVAWAWAHFVGFGLLYCCVVVPLQELLARGLLQGLLERLIEGQARRRMWLSILVSNLVFSAFHLYLSMAVAAATFVLGLYLGWLYARSRHLLAPCVAHGIIGTWGLTVVRLQHILPGVS